MISGVDGQTSEAVLSIDSSQITIRVTNPLSLDLASLKNAYSVLPQLACDAITWGNGCAYRVEMTSYSSEHETAVFGVDIPALGQPTSEAASTETNRVLRMLFQSTDAQLQRQFRRALADYREAFLSPDDTPELCWRAVEALMYVFERNNERGRRHLCERLRLDEKWLAVTLERPADELRHGKVRLVTHSDRIVALTAAREVLSRFVALMENPDQKLPLQFARLVLAS